MKKHVALIVEDEPEIRELIADQLSLINVSSVEASNGEEALAVLKDSEISIVVSDLAMPKMNGFELLRKMKSNGFTMPVVILTGHADQMVAQQLRTYGIKGFINKPWGPEEIQKTVQSILGLPV